MKFVRPPCPSCAEGRLLRETAGDGSTRLVCDTCYEHVVEMGVTYFTGLRETAKTEAA